MLASSTSSNLIKREWLVNGRYKAPEEYCVHNDQPYCLTFGIGGRKTWLEWPDAIPDGYKLVPYNPDIKKFTFRMEDVLPADPDDASYYQQWN